jgi:hypothetical protein
MLAARARWHGCQLVTVWYRYVTTDPLVFVRGFFAEGDGASMVVASIGMILILGELFPASYILAYWRRPLPL